MTEIQQWIVNGSILFIVVCAYWYFNGIREAHYESKRDKLIESRQEDIMKAVDEFSKLPYMDYSVIGAKSIFDLSKEEQIYSVGRLQVSIAIMKLRGVL